MATNGLRLTLIAALLAGAAGGAALAEGPNGRPFEGRPMGPAGFSPMEFADLDRDGDGQITASDLQAAAEARVAGVDADGDGAVTVEELLAWQDAQENARRAERAAGMIARLDANGDGVLQLTELQAMGSNGDRMIAIFDEDGDGAVSPEEFAAAQERMARGHEGRGQGRGEGRGHGPRDGGHGEHGPRGHGQDRGAPPAPLDGQAPAGE